MRRPFKSDVHVRANERTAAFVAAINTPLRCSFNGDDRRIQDDRGTVRHERKRLLYRKEEALHIRVKKRVVMLLGDLAQGSELRETGIREDNVKLAFLSFDLREEAVKIGKARNVSRYARDISSDLLHGRGQLRFTPPRDEHVRAFVHKLLRRRQTDAGASARDQCNLFRQPHVALISFLDYCYNL